MGIFDNLQNKQKKALIAFVGVTFLALFSLLRSCESFDLEDYNLSKIKDERLVRIESLLTLLENDSKDYRTRYEVGRLYSEIENYKNAIVELTLANQDAEKEGADPKTRYDILNELADALSKDGQALKSMQVLKRAKELNPQNPRAYNKTGNLYDRAEKVTQAKAEYLKAKQIDKTDPEAYKNLANQEFKQNNIKKAIEYLKDSIRKNPKSFSAFENLGDGYMRVGEYQKAQKAYDRAIGLNSKYSILDYKKSRAHNKLSQELKEEAALKNGYQKNSKNPRINEALGDLAARREDFKKALDFYIQAYKNDSFNKALRKKIENLKEKLTPKPPIQKIANNSSQNFESLNSNNLDDLELEKDRGNKLIKKGIESIDKNIDKEVEEIIKSGKKAFSDKKYGLAERNFKKAQQKKSNYPSLDYFLARSQDKQGNYKDASYNYQLATEKDPNKAKIWYYLGRSLYLQNQFKKALSAFQKSFSLDNNMVSAQYSIGLCEDKLGDHEGAIQAYKKTISIDPTLFEAQKNLGISYKKKGDYDLSLSTLNQALKLKEDPELHYQIGEISYKRDSYPEAIESLTNAVNIDPAHYEARFNLALVYIKQNKHSNAKEQLNQILLRKKNDPETLYTLGKLLELEGDYESAISRYQQAVNNNPKYLKGYINLGRVYSQINNYIDSESSYKKALAIQSDSIDANQNLANLYFRNKKHDQALPYYQAALRISPEKTDIRLLYAQSLEKIEKFSESKDQYNTILRYDPKNELALDRLAFLYYRKLKDNLKAKATFKKLLEYYPKSSKKEKYEQIINLL